MDFHVGLQLVLTALLVFVVARMFLGKVPPAKARELVKNGARLVDVRTQGEFSQGHLDGAVNIPVQELRSRLAEVGPKDVPVVVYCASGARSASARSILQKAGFVAHDLGAMRRWG